jgi:uncharacterized phage protein gp47/JayE
MNKILTDYANLDSQPATSEGSIVFIKAACLASALWGLYRFCDYVSQQIFPDTADTDNLNHHGYILGLTRQPGESDTDYLTRILDFLRQPAAGGNANDIVTWVKSVPPVATYYVKTATVLVPPTSEPGTSTVVVDPNDESILSTQAMIDLVTAVQAYVDIKRPVTSVITVVPVSILLVDVTIHVSGTDLDIVTMAADVAAYVASLNPGDTLYLSKLSSICITDGANDATVIQPTVNIVPVADHVVRINGSPNIVVV